MIVAVLILGMAIAFTLYSQPATVSDWFELFQRNKILGLLDFWGLEVLMYGMFALVFLALYFSLKDAEHGLMAIAITFSLLGIGIFLATNKPFSMLSLSNQYATATTESERSMLLAAGQTVLTNTSQRVVGGFNVALFLVSIAGLIMSIVMLRSSAFSSLTAYVGISAWTLSLVDYLRQIMTESATIALLVILPNTLLLVIWFALVGRTLYRTGQPKRESLDQ